MENLENTSAEDLQNKGLLGFEKQFFEEAALFLKLDIQMTKHMTDIVGSLANYLKENPDKSIELFAGRAFISNNPGTQDLDTGKLLEKIVDFFLGDKEFFFKLIVLFHCGCKYLPSDWNK